MMVKVLVYGYATGTCSSRKLAKRLEEDIAFRMLAAGNFPRHRTLCEFRRRHLDDFGAVFAEVVRLARRMGLAGLGRVSVDGTKVRANASKRKAMSYGRMTREGAAAEGGDCGAAGEGGGGRRSGGCALRRGRSRGRAAGGAEGARGPAGGDRGGEGASGRPSSGRRTTREAASRGKKRNPKGGHPYKRGYGEPEEKAQSNFTDPESRIMKTSSEGFQQCYNAQTAVEGD